MKYYFVSYQMQGDVKKISNILLKNIHPLVWAARPLRDDIRITTHVLFWEEIEESVALNIDVQRYFPFQEGEDFGS